MKKILLPLLCLNLFSCAKLNEYHTITFHVNDGSFVPVQHVVDGDLAVEPKNPTKETFVFAGWYVEDSLTNYFDFSTKITKDYDLYARWEGEFEYHVSLDAENKLELENDKGFFNQKDYVSKIILKDEYRNKYDLPYSEDYYEVTVNDNPIDNFKIEQVIYGTDIEYYVNITIPKEELGARIGIKTKPYCHYLTFAAVEDNATISYTIEGTLPIIPQIEYATSLDISDWQTWNANSVITLRTNQSIYVRNKINSLSIGTNGYLTFHTGGETAPKIACDGNIMSLLNFSKLQKGCFALLFTYCHSLTKAPVLPALELSDTCYQGMFRFLPECPILPAKKMAYGCYASMFVFSSMTKAPKLPATELAEGCYLGMFMNCENLVIPPQLPAKTLAKKCYEMMFSDCKKLKLNDTGDGTNFFECPDTTPKSCVNDMFKGTGGTFKGTPETGVSYYYASPEGENR